MNDTWTPETVAADILSGRIASPPAPDDAAAATRRLCILPNAGRFRLEWSVVATGSYDWVGLYASRDAGNGDPVSGAWQWANASPKILDTSAPIQANYEARYLVWDSSVQKYTVVARTPGFPNVVMNSTLVGYPRNPTATEWQTLRSNFPNLTQSTCWVTGPTTSIYNCIAWSLGLDDRWIDPASPLSAFQNLYQSWGDKVVAKLSSAATIDAWGTSSANCTHGSKLYAGAPVGPANLWESKCGGYLRITHAREGVDSPLYGSIIGSFTPGFSLNFAEVLEMAAVRDLDVDEVTRLAASVADVPSDIVAEFEAAFAGWKATWFAGDLMMSNDTHDFARGDDYKKLTSLGADIVPLLVAKLRERDNFPALVLYDEIQSGKGLSIAYTADDPLQFEGEQARAARTVGKWIAAQRGRS